MNAIQFYKFQLAHPQAVIVYTQVSAIQKSWVTWEDRAQDEWYECANHTLSLKSQGFRSADKQSWLDNAAELVRWKLTSAYNVKAYSLMKQKTHEYYELIFKDF